VNSSSSSLRFVLALTLVPLSISACGAEGTETEPVGSLAQALDPPSPPSIGAYTSGVYRNLFKEWNPSLTDSSVQAKLDQLWNHYFLGGATAKLYYANGTNANGPKAYIYDTGNRDVRSEGMSYGMMISVQMDKKSHFDAIWNWAKTNMQYQGTEWDGYFAWQCNTRGQKIGTTPASDGEEYFATALFFAAHRWGNGTGIYNYEAEANRILDTMLHKEDMNGGVLNGVTNIFNHTEKQVVFVPYFSSATHTDPSYHLPAFYELWGRWAQGYNGQQAADRQFWLDAAATSRQFFAATTHPVTGLNPDYAEFDGTAKGDAFGDNGTHDDFRFDAWRTAVNWSVDYAWWAADTNEITLTNRLQAFFTGQGIATYGNQYTLDGTALSTTHSVGLVASNGAASLAASDAQAWDFVAALWNTGPVFGNYRYYDGVLQFMATLHSAGAFRVH
jgi:oligosaccharide reducing-end xylanase